MKKAFTKYASLLFIVFMTFLSFWYVGNEEAVMGNTAKVPILMYHSVSDIKEGMYTVPEAKLEGDLKYLKENGYEAVTCKELVSILKEGRKMPSKPVIITFDDGYYNNLALALPLLEKYNMSAVISVVGEFTKQYDECDDKTVSYACLDSEDIKALIASHRIEIANHSYNMHHEGARKGTMQIKGENDEKYKKAFCDDAQRCHDYILKNCNYNMTTYTYPYGQITKSTKEYLKDMGYETFLSCDERINILEDSSIPLSLGRFNRDGRLSTEEFMRKSGI